MKIHKVKRTDGLITVVFSKKNKVGDDDEFSMKCHDAPVAGFQKAFDALTPAVVQICELGEEYGNTLVVTGASFSYGGEAEVMGVVITAQKALCTANSPLIINTPHLPSEDVSGQGNEPTLSKKQVKALEELQRQTVNYVEGKRLQLELKLEGADDMKAKEEEVVEDLVSQATGMMKETGRITTSMVQRRLRIGYTQAARLMDVLEERAIIGPPRGTKPREILIDVDTKEQGVKKGKKAKVAA